MRWHSQKGRKVVRWQKGEGGGGVGGGVQWQDGKYGRVVRWQGGRFPVLFKGEGRRVRLRFHLFVSDGSQRN